ncbi:TRAF3-interacting protein 1 [Habropoda laboriosa]|uniref:TRAF3-interacting protein 1 n=1 Tax=Habropoda laboriosa TaxID=597456 RepID=A0A0L7RH59_9HYME|nr:TRAF3-interacting protein 1 [Habropoda laboriosa]
MADDVKPEVIKKTQDLLGKYFKKPPLTEKLLRKPPFRFLHDIVSAVIKETGFLDGLYSEEELNSENIKNKEAKLAYLTKLIDVVKLATGFNLTVRASKIISGQEPCKTNELLQAIGKALDKKKSSVEAIEQYKKSLEKGKSTSRTTNEVGTRKSGKQESPKTTEVTQISQVESTSSTSLSETVPFLSDKKTDESKRQKESENKSKHTVYAENNETQNEILNTSETVYSESKPTTITKDNKIIESTEKAEHKENEIKNNEGFLQNTEKSDQSMTEIQKSQSENNDVSSTLSVFHNQILDQKLLYVLLLQDQLVPDLQHLEYEEKQN